MVQHFTKHPSNNLEEALSALMGWMAPATGVEAP